MSDRHDRAAGTCRTCTDDLPAGHTDYCSAACRKRSRNRQKNARKQFLRNAKRPVAIDVVAERFGISVPEATRRAEHDITAGRLLAWRHRDGRLAEVSSPLRAPDGRQVP